MIISLKKMVKNKKIFFFLFFFILFSWLEISAYSLEEDSLNSFGSEISQSTNYKIFDTAGQFSSGLSEGTNFSINSGYRQLDGGEITISCGSLNLAGIQFSGKSNLEKNFVNCNVKSSDPAGYIFAINSTSSKLINTENSQHKIESIINTSPNFWPTTLTNGTGWGVHLGTQSDNFDTTIWGDLNDYGMDTSPGSVSGKWVGIYDNTNFNLISKNSRTSEVGDNERIYFGFEVDSDTIIPAGEYQTEIFFTALPTF